MPNFPSRTSTAAHAPTRPRRERQKLLRWATVTLLLLLAAVAASRA